MKQISITITGKVQGVAFRQSAKYMADSLGLNGYAKNQYDGSVLIIAQGEDDRIDLLLDWCSRGPARARVDEVGFYWNEILAKYECFEIR